MMQVTNAIIWTICVSIIVFICVLWFVICYIGLCKLRRNRRKPPLPVYAVQPSLKDSNDRDYAVVRRGGGGGGVEKSDWVEDGSRR
ncbi:hypothetical protein E2C01_032542 [Portunus trituberculatus]|uniref:Uncharacterized protein n=1 Tax=Portunus trituberculatus TaxID=210409 RepID=A0A5B7F1N9_PORTR|nr:hypothetical protein [Portunus trituberculatus]